MGLPANPRSAGNASNTGNIATHTEVRHPRGPLIPEIRVTPPERNRLILVALAGFVLLWLLNQSIDALGPFILALVLAYLMLPLVDRLSRYLPRVLAIIVVYLVFIGVVVGLVAWLAPQVTGQVSDLVKQGPTYSRQVEEWATEANQWYASLPLSRDIRDSIENAARSSLGALGSAIQQGLVGALRVFTRALGFIVGLLIIPFWLFYVLKDKDRGIAAFNNMLPEKWRTDVWRIVRIINGVLTSYIRGQLLLGLLVGIASTVGLLLVGAPYALLLGIIAGITELIPVLGPVLGAIPALILAAFHPEGWIMVLKVLVVFVVVQQLENNLLVPKVQGDSVKLHPAVIMVSLVVGSQVGGLFGLIVAVPVAAILRDIYVYLYRRFTEGYSPREAEASVPSRQHDETIDHKKHEKQDLEEDLRNPGLNSEAEVISNLESSRSIPQPDAGARR